MKKYQFESASGTVKIERNANYYGDCYDVNVYVDEPWNEQEFTEIDQIDEVFAWLIDVGVEWVGPQAFLVNYKIAQECMLDGDGDEYEIMRRYDSMDRGEATKKIRNLDFDPKFKEAKK